MVWTTALILSLLPAQDDRARILDAVESWYKVVQDGKNKGYVHERLERVKDTWTYAVRTDFEIAVKNGWHLEYSEVEATLDEEMGVETFQSRTDAAGILQAFKVMTEAEKRWVVVSEPGKADRPMTIPAELHASANVLFYSLRQGGRLSKTGPRSVRMIRPRAEGRLETEVSFEVAPLARKTIAGKSSPVTPIKFLKPPPATRPETEWVEALVDKYGRFVEITLRGGATIVLVENEGDAFRDATHVHRWASLEPWDKKRAFDAARTSTDFPEEPRTPKITLDNLASNLEAARKMLDDLRGHKDAARTNELVDGYFRFLRLWKALREKADALGCSNLVPKADELRDSAESLWDGAAQALAAALRSTDAAIEAFGRGDVAGVEREVRALRDARSRIELERRPELAKVLKLAASVEPLAARCRTRHELAKKSILVTGIVLASTEEPMKVEVAPGVIQNVRFVRDLSTAAINGKSYRAGEELDGDGLRLEKVSSRSVTVSLGGELREVPLGDR